MKIFKFFIVLFLVLELFLIPYAYAEIWDTILIESNELPDGNTYATAFLSYIYDGGKRGVKITVTANESILIPNNCRNFGIQSFGFNTTITDPENNLIVTSPPNWICRFKDPGKMYGEFGRFHAHNKARGKHRVNPAHNKAGRKHRVNPCVIEIYHETGDLELNDFIVENTLGYYFSSHIADFKFNGSDCMSAFFGTQEEPSTTTTTSIPSTTTSSIPTTTSSIPTTTSSIPTTTSSIPTTTSSIHTTTSSIPTTTSSIPTTTSSILTTTSSVSTTTSSVLTTTTSTISTCASKIYRGGVCEESSPLDTIYNRPGRRGLSITCCEEEEFCICTSCEGEDAIDHCWSVEILPGSDPDFTLDNLVADTGTGDQFTLKVADPCTEHCPDEVVYLGVIIEDCAVPGIELDSVEVQIGRVALGLGTTNSHPNTQTADVSLLLWNPENHGRALQVDVGTCDYYACQGLNQVECTNEEDELLCAWVDDECVAVDNMVCTECIVDEERTTEYICSASEQEDGRCRVTLYTTEPDDLIQQGSGPIARIKYDIGGELTSKDCVCLWPSNIKVSDQFNEELCASPKAGEICFRICGDVYPQDCYECTSCGDGVVDLFDVLEEVDITLGLQTATDCQELHGDVPLGMPPYCGNPPGVNPPNCETDGIIDLFDVLVITDKALSKLNCCDYCMYGEIY